MADYVANKLHIKVEAPTTEAYVYKPIDGVSEVIAETDVGNNDGEFVWFDGVLKHDGK